MIKQLLLWLRHHMDAAVATLSLMFQLTLLSSKRIGVSQLVSCKQELNGATAATEELHAWSLKTLSTMTHQFKDAQQRITLMLILISISHSDFQTMSNKLKILFTNLVQEDLMNFSPQKSKKIFETLFKVSGLVKSLILSLIWLTLWWTSLIENLHSTASNSNNATSPMSSSTHNWSKHLNQEPKLNLL